MLRNKNDMYSTPVNGAFFGESLKNGSVVNVTIDVEKDFFEVRCKDAPFSYRCSAQLSG
jgi:hypothetical protein